jgi:hypothetical protein
VKRAYLLKGPTQPIGHPFPRKPEGSKDARGLIQLACSFLVTRICNLILFLEFKNINHEIVTWFMDTLSI